MKRRVGEDTVCGGGYECQEITFSVIKMCFILDQGLIPSCGPTLPLHGPLQQYVDLQQPSLCCLKCTDDPTPQHSLPQMINIAPKPIMVAPTQRLACNHDSCGVSHALGLRRTSILNNLVLTAPWCTGHGWSCGLHTVFVQRYPS
jgi:hypothetical protein